MNLADYLFKDPVSGRWLILVVVLAITCLAVALVAWVAAGRLRFLARRRRARRLRSIMLGTAVLTGVYLAARYLPIPVVSWRIWLYLILLSLLAQLVWWALSLRQLETEIVDEGAALRKKAYFKRAKTKKAKRPKRRRP